MTNFRNLTDAEMLEVDGGIMITVLGITLTGAKAVAAIAGGTAVVGGAFGAGLWLGLRG